MLFFFIWEKKIKNGVSVLCGVCSKQKMKKILALKHVFATVSSKQSKVFKLNFIHFFLLISKLEILIHSLFLYVVSCTYFPTFEMIYVPHFCYVYLRAQKVFARLSYIIIDQLFSSTFLLWQEFSLPIPYSSPK